MNLLIKSSGASVIDFSADITCGMERFESTFFFGVNCKKAYEDCPRKFVDLAETWTQVFQLSLTKERTISL